MAFGESHPERVRIMMRMLYCLVALLCGPAVNAEEWELITFDDGSFFSATMRPDNGAGFSLVCGERSPQGLSALQTGNMEPAVTRRDSFRLYLENSDIGQLDADTFTRQDVLIVLGTQGYRVPVLQWNELFGVWETDLQATDPVFAAIAGQPSFELRSQAKTLIITGNGFSAALDQLTAHCQAMFTTIGQPWSTVAAAPTTQVTMRQIAEAAVQTGCGGPANLEPDAFLSGNIDGDSQTDVVVDWSRITCSGGYPRPFCGASMCSANVYLSASYQARQRPEELLALGVGLIELNNGNMGVATGGSLAMCQGRAGNGCEFIWYWTGDDFVSLN